MRLEVRFDNLAPAPKAVAPLAVELGQRLGVLGRKQAHTLEEGVANQNGKAPAVDDHGLGGGGRGLVHLGAGVLPFVNQAGVDGANHHREPRDDVFQAIVALVERDGAIEHAVHVRQVAQKRALVARDLVAGNVAFEGGARLYHLAQDALGHKLVIGCPGHRLAIHLEGLVKLLGQGFGIGDFLKLVHALVVAHAFGLHRGHGLRLRPALLRPQNLARVLDRGLRHRDDVERVIVRLGIEQLERRQEEGRQGLVEREILGHVDGKEVIPGAVFEHLVLHHAGRLERCEHLVGARVQGQLLVGALARGLDEPLQARAHVAAALHQIDHHGIGDAHARLQGFGACLDKLLEGAFVPGHLTLRRTLELELALLFGIVARLGAHAGVLDFVIGRLHQHHALGVEARPAGATGDLVELARVEPAHPMTVVLDERRQKHRVDGHVDAHAQGVGAADDREQALLGKLFNQQTVAREHARMVHAHAASEQALQGFAEGGGEARSLAGFLDALALLLGGHAVAGQGLCRVERSVLREMDNVNGGLALAQGQLDRAFHRGIHVFIAQGNGALGVGHHIDGTTGTLLKRGCDLRGVAQSGAHKKEACIGELDERDLPGPAAIDVAVEVELVHDDGGDVRRGALAQGAVGQDLGGAADNRRIGVDGDVARDHADVVAPQKIHQVEELLAHQGLDGRGVIRDARVGAQIHEMHAQRDQRFARARGRAQDDVVAHRDAHQGFLLMGPHLDAALLHPTDEGHQQLVGVDRLFLARAAVQVVGQKAQTAETLVIKLEGVLRARIQLGIGCRRRAGRSCRACGRGRRGGRAGRRDRRACGRIRHPAWRRLVVSDFL